MRKLAQRAVIAAASVLTIMSAVGVADLLGQAHADPQCVAGAADRCPPQADPPRADPPEADPPRRPHIQIFCQPGGALWGAFCRQQIVP
jgi:hypothetical protein